MRCGEAAPQQLQLTTLTSCGQSETRYLLAIHLADRSITWRDDHMITKSHDATLDWLQYRNSLWIDIVSIFDPILNSIDAPLPDIYFTYDKCRETFHLQNVFDSCKDDVMQKRFNEYTIQYNTAQYNTERYNKIHRQSCFKRAFTVFKSETKTNGFVSSLTLWLSTYDCYSADNASHSNFWNVLDAPANPSPF